MSETKTQVSVGFFGLLALLFIALKLTGYISWPWLWVLSPIWLPPAIGLTLFAFAFAIAFVVIGIFLLLKATK
jgi:hypothetical protein